MTSKFRRIAAIGLGLGLLVNPFTKAQEDGEYNNMWSQNSPIYSQDDQNYNSFTRDMEDGEKLKDIQSLMKSEYLPEYGHKLEKILNEAGQLSEGDNITVVESQTPEGIYYPYYLNLDYLDPEKKDLELIASLVPAQEDRPFRFTLNYHDFNGRMYMTLWNNKERPGFFESEGPYPNIAKFILPGSMDEYRLTSPFGYRKDPLDEDSGGSATQFHPAVDFAMKDHSNMYGTEIIAPMDGFVRFGYVQEENSDNSTIEDEKSSGRYIKFRSNDETPILFPNGQLKNTTVNYSFFHSRAASEELIRKAMPRGATDWWWTRTLSSELNFNFNEEDLINNIRTNHEEGRLRRLGISTEWIPVNQGDIIGKVDDTGKKSGIHIHYGILLNGNWVDPLVFQDYNEIKQDFSLQEMKNKKRLIEDILGK